MSDDTERLKAQVVRLETDVRKHLEAVSHAGEKARQMRAEIDMLQADRRHMAAVLGEVLNAEGVPEWLRSQARDALEGPYADVPEVDPDVRARIVARFEGEPA